MTAPTIKQLLDQSEVPNTSRDLAQIPESVDPALRKVLVHMREAIQELSGNRGDERNAAVRWADLIANGFADINFFPAIEGLAGPAGPTGATGATGTITPDLTPPPSPTGLTVVAGFTRVIVQWNVATYTQGHGPKQTNVYAVRKDPSDPTLPTFPGSAGLIASAPHALTIIDLPSELNTRWHVWIKFETNDGKESVDPTGWTNGYNVDGVYPTTGLDVSALLAVMTGKITQSQLFSTLGARIDLIDAADSVTGSVNARVKVVNDGLTTTNGNVTTLSSQVNNVTTGLPATRALLLSDYQTAAGMTSALSSLTTSLQTYADGAAGTAAAGAVSTAQSYTNSYAYSNSSGTTLAGNFSALNSTVTDGTTGLAATRSLLLTDYATSATLTSSLTTLTTTLQSYADGAASGAVSTAQSYTNSYAYADSAGSALASSVSTLSTSVNSPTTLNNPTYAALSTEASVRSGETGNLFAQYTVKIDTNGYVSGYGLASTATNAAPSSAFAVRADQFYIASPSGPGIAAVVPFIVRTTVTTENGVTIPIGVYMDSAYIVNVSAMYARFGTLIADSIAAGSINAAHLTLGDDLVGGDLKSTSFSSGSGSTPGVGWKLTPGGTIYASSAVIYGTIYASAGVFAGALNAATGTFAGALSAATGTFAGDISASTGTFAGTFTGNLNVSSGGSDRMEITTTRIKIFAGGVERVRLGNLA